MQPNLPDYQEQARINKERLFEALRQAYPELHMVAKMMDEIQFNPVVLFHTMNHASQIAKGTGFGQVHIIIEDGIVRFVRGEHSTKLNEPVIVRESPIEQVEQI